MGPRYDVPRNLIDGLVLRILLGSLIGARLYFIIQNDPGTYLREPWRVLAIWEGGLAYFGGLFGGVLAAFLYARLRRLPFLRVADLFAPAILIGSAIGRIACGLDGMDYGTPTSQPWGIVYTNPRSFAPIDGIPRHPAQFYELIGDVIMAGLLIRLRGSLPEGRSFTLYLILFCLLRFFIFFVRGNVEPVALGLKNGQWTALAILIGAILLWFRIGARKKENERSL